MKRLTFILTTLLILLLPVWAGAATYYVTDDAGGAGIGTEGDPWTLTQLNAASLGTNDTAYLNNADTFTETLNLNSTAATTSGITIDGSTWGAGTKARINGNVAVPIIINHALVNLTLKDIDISGSDANVSSNEYRCYLQHINGLTIDGIDYNGHTGSSVYYQANAMTIIQVDGDIEIKNCTIQNVMKDTFDNTRTDWGSGDAVGIIFWYNTALGGVKTSGTVSIHDNTIHDVYTDCLHLTGIRTNTNIYNNTFYNFGENALDFKASGESTVTVDVYENNMYHNDFGEALGSAFYGPAIIAGSTGSFPVPSDPDNRYITIRDNYLHDCATTGIHGILPHSNIYRNYFKDVFQPIENNDGYDYIKIYNNVFDCTAGVTTSTSLNSSGYTYASVWNVAIKRSIFYYRLALADNLLYNNTIYCTHADYSYGIVVRGHASSSGQKIKNNVIHMTQAAGPYLIYWDGVGVEPDVDYNALYNPNHANRISGTTDANGITTDNGINFPTNFWPDADGDAVVNAGISKETDANVPANGLRSVSDWTTLPGVNNISTIDRAGNQGADIGAYEREMGGIPPAGDTLDVDQDNANDDGVVYSDGVWSTTKSGYLYFGDTNNNDQNSEGHLRFVVTGPASGVTIDSAYITFRCETTKTAGTNITISAEDADAASLIDSVADFDNAVTVQTTATVNWQPGALTAGNDYQTSSLVTVIQEIITRGGWASGNEINILLEDNGSTTWEHFKTPSADETNEPVLHVEWSTGAGAPTIAAIGTATVTAGVVTFTANTTETETATGDPGWFWAVQLSEQLGPYATPEPSEFRWDSGPITASYNDSPYYGHLPDAGPTNYYLLYTPNLLAGHRIVNPQAYGTTAADYIILNDAVLEDGDSNDLDLTYATVDIDGTGEIDISVPYPSTAPKEFSSTSTLADAQIAGFYAIGDDYLGVTDAGGIGAADMSASDGTSGHPITLDGGGFEDNNSKTYGDYWVITRSIS